MKRRTRFVDVANRRVIDSGVYRGKMCMCVSVCVVVFYFTAAAADGDDRSLDGDTMVNTRFAVRKTAPCNVWRGKLPGPECAVSFSC